MSPASDQTSSIDSAVAAAPRPAAASRGLASPWAHVVRGDPDAVPAASSSPPIPAPDPADPSIPLPADPETAAFAGQRPPPPASEGADQGCNGNAGAAARGKKPAWNVPSNGSNEVGPVMGALAWPALSDSARASPKSSSSDSLKALSDGSVNSTPVLDLVSSSYRTKNKDYESMHVPVIASPQPKTNTNNPSNTGPTANHTGSGRHRPSTNPNSMKRGGGGGSGSSSSSSVNGRPASPQQPPASAEMPPVGLEKGPESSPKDVPNKGNDNSDHSMKDALNKGNNSWDQHRSGGSTPQQHSGGDHHQGFGGNRRGNNGGRGGVHHGGYGSRRDHEHRGGYDWNASRVFNGRDPHTPVSMPQQRGPSRPFIRPPPPPPAAPFMSPFPQVRPFMGPMGYPEIPPIYYVPTPPPLESLRNVPLVAQVPPTMPPPAFLAPVDHQRDLLLKQIEYYFSPQNLCKDTFLRHKMDEEGWVSISLIAGFNRVRQLTNNIQYILDTLRASTELEVLGDKIRKRGDWMNWIMPPSPNQYSSGSSYHTQAASDVYPPPPTQYSILSGHQFQATSDYDSLSAHMQAVGLEESSNQRGGPRGHESASGDFSSRQ